MPRVALRLFGPAQLTNAAATKYTVPASRLGILMRIHVSNPSVSTVNFTLSIGADAAATRMFDAYPIGPGVVFSFPCYTELAAAEIIQAFASTTSVLVLVLEGEESILG
jgi:hypothetical protein